MGEEQSTTSSFINKLTACFTPQNTPRETRCPQTNIEPSKPPSTIKLPGKIKQLVQTTLTGKILVEQPKPKRQKPNTAATHGNKTPNSYTQAAEQLSQTQAQSKLKDIYGLLYPTGPALNHPAADFILNFGTDGCPVDCGPEWTIKQIQDAIDYAAHPSAQVPEAAQQLRLETLEKVKQGYAKLVLWDDLRQNPPGCLKVSPIAAIPHKTRKYRAILDLSFVLQHLRDELAPVNDNTKKQSHPMALDQLGQVLPRLFQLLAWAPGDDGPLMFQKLDIKDGYWRGVVEKGAEWNFCYVLPKLDPNEPTQLVVPDCLQMGWGESPGYFCMASETARDVGEQLTFLPVGALPTHELEDLTMEDYQTEMDKLEISYTPYDNPHGPDWLPPSNLVQPKAFGHLVEVFIDDFIQAAQTTDETTLRHLSSSLLHGIHYIFPPPKWTGHTRENPIHPKKTRLEGTWEFKKEILVPISGWSGSQNRTNWSEYGPISQTPRSA